MFGNRDKCINYVSNFTVLSADVISCLQCYQCSVPVNFAPYILKHFLEDTLNMELKFFLRYFSTILPDKSFRYIIIPSFYFVDCNIVHNYVTYCMTSISEPHFPHKSVATLLSFCRPTFA